jgi:hypothetical protein
MAALDDVTVLPTTPVVLQQSLQKETPIARKEEPSLGIVKKPGLKQQPRKETSLWKKLL